MPYLLGNTLVVQKEELIPDWWNCYASLKTTLWRYKEKPYGIKRAQLGGNGRKLLIDFDTLPKEIQDALGDPRKPDHVLVPFFRFDDEATRYYTEFERPNFGHLQPKERDRYILNASVFKALIKLEEARIHERLTKGGSLRATRDVRSVSQSILDDSISFNDYLYQEYKERHNLPSHPRRFRKKFKEFKEESYYCLIKDPEGKSMKNAAKVDDEVISLLNNLFSGQSFKPTAADVIRQYNGFLDGYVQLINNASGEVYDPKSFNKIGDTTVKEYLRSWENKIGTHSKRSGDRQKLMTRMQPYASLEPPVFSGSLISIDDRQPPFKYEGNKRVWFYLAIDVASKAITCWVYGKTKEELILNFYRQLVRNYHEWGFNLPAELECESSLNSSYRNTLLQNGAMFQDVRMFANKARSKMVEREFRELRYSLEKKREGWVARPNPKSEANEAGPGKDILIPYERIIHESLTDIITVNNSPHHVDKTMSKWDYFTQNQNPDLNPTNYKYIMYHIGIPQPTSCNVGLTKLQYKEWVLGNNEEICTGEKLIGLMKKLEGKSFMAYYLDDNEGEVFKAMVYDDEGRYICELLPKPIPARTKIEETEAQKEAREIWSRYETTVVAFMKTQRAALDNITVIDNTPRTISNSFTIPGIHPFEKSEEEAIDLGYAEEEDLPEYIPNENPEITWNKHLKI